MKRVRSIGGLLAILMFVAIAHHFGWQRGYEGRPSPSGLIADAKAETFAEGGRRTYYPITETLGSNEMRVISLGTGMPNQRNSQASACWLVELGNGDKFLFDLGTGSVANLSVLEIHYDYVKKVFLGHLHSDHAGDFAAWFIGRWVGGRQTAPTIWGPDAPKDRPEWGTKHFVEHQVKSYAWDIEGRSGRLPTVAGKIVVNEFPHDKFSVVYEENGVKISAWPAVHIAAGWPGRWRRWRRPLGISGICPYHRPMARTKIFLSHSSHSPDHQAILLRLRQGLSARGLTVLLDLSGDIKPGDEWDRTLNQWMAECHAAVILFSRDVLKSSYVKKEAAILTWRKRLDGDRFLLTGALLDDVQPQDIATDPEFRVLRMSDFQFIRDCWVDDNPEQTADRILDQLHGILPATPALETPFDRLEKRVGRILQRAAMVEELEEAWEDLPAEGRPQWSKASDVRFSEAISRFLFANHTQPLPSLRVILRRLPDIDRRAAVQILRYVQPLWVDSEAAGCLADARAEGHPSGVCLRCGHFDAFTAAHYSRRAWPDEKPIHVPLTGQETTSESIIKTVVNDLLERDPESKVSDADLTFIRERLDEVPVLLVSPPGISPPDAALVRAVERELPCLVILAGLPVGGPPALPGLRSLPDIDGQLEDEQDRERGFTKTFLRSQYENDDVL